MTRERPERERSNLEKHVQTAVAFVMVGMLGWTGTNLNDYGKTISILLERVDNLLQQKKTRAVTLVDQQIQQQ